MKHVEFIASYLTQSGPCYNKGDRALVPDALAESAIQQRAAIEISKQVQDSANKEAKGITNKQVKAAPASK